MYLHHYFNRENGPFRSISELSEAQAGEVFHSMARYLYERDGKVYNPAAMDGMIAQRQGLRRKLEAEMRQKFIEKGGKAPRAFPYYLILSDKQAPEKALLAFYRNGDYLTIPVEKIDMDTVSFTYGDSMVQYYHPQGGKFELVYTYAEIRKLIEARGWVGKDENDWGFVEAQLWSDLGVNEYRVDGVYTGI